MRFVICATSKQSGLVSWRRQGSAVASVQGPPGAARRLQCNAAKRGGATPGVQRRARGPLPRHRAPTLRRATGSCRSCGRRVSRGWQGPESAPFGRRESLVFWAS
ncbi:unnamed protein product [Ixodes persulcatus]